MNYEIQLSLRDVKAVDGFIKTMTDSGVASKQLETVRDYCLLSLTAREDQDFIVPTEDVDSPLLIKLETTRKTIERDLIRVTDQFLQEHLSTETHDFTVNPRMDDHIRPPVSLYEVLSLSPLKFDETKGWPEGVLIDALKAFWPQSNVSPRTVANALRYKQ
jgi:hypothetical protein